MLPLKRKSSKNGMGSNTYRVIPFKMPYEFGPGLAGRNRGVRTTNQEESSNLNKETWLNILLWLTSFFRETIAVLLFYWMKHQLGSELFYAKVFALFGVNFLMKLPFINPLIFLMSIVTNHRMKQANINSFIHENVTIFTMSGFAEVLFYIMLYMAAEMFGAYLAVISITSSEFFFGRVTTQHLVPDLQMPSISVPNPSAFGRPQDISWQVCPSRDWNISKMLSITQQMKDVNADRISCFARKNIPLDTCYTYSYHGSEDGTINDAVFNCISPDLWTYWIFNEAVAVTIYLIMALHVWSLLYKENKKKIDEDDKSKSPLRSRQSQYINSIWNTAAYMSVITFVIQLTFPFARCNPIDCIFTLISIGIHGTPRPSLENEMWFRMLGQVIGFVVLCVYYAMAYVYDTNEYNYIIAWGELPPTDELVAQQTDDSEKGTTVTLMNDIDNPPHQHTDE